MRIHPKKVRKIQTYFSAILLIAIIVTIFYFNSSTIFAFKSKGATKLVVIITGDNIQSSGRECTILIRAVDDEGILDTSRDDTVRLTITAGPTAKISKEKVVLKNGEASAKVVSYVAEPVYIDAIWEDGKSYLRPGANVVFYF